MAYKITSYMANFTDLGGTIKLSVNSLLHNKPSHEKKALS
jgi:hypothetical protein